MEKDLVVANDDENHTNGTGLKEEVGAEGGDGLGVGERSWRLRLRESREGGQQEQKDKEDGWEFKEAHSCWQFFCT
jgi:hypothetical protein